MENRNVAEVIETDIVIIGAGGAGLAAALTAVQNGVTGVTVLEKREVTGGNTAMATGLFACESPTQARDKIVADRDELFKHAMGWCHWNQVDPAIVRAFLNRSGSTIDWLGKMGLEFNVIAFFPNQNPRVEHVAQGRGAGVTQTLERECRRAGVRLLTGHAATNLEVKDGVVWEVTAVSGENTVQVRAGSAIIASGGFGGNGEMLKTLCSQYYDGMTLRGLPLTGDGIRMAAGVGAAIEASVPLLKEGPRVDKNVWPLGGLEREPCTLWVNRLGKRFVDETTGSHPFEGANQILYQPERVCYTIVDSDLKDAMMRKLPRLEQGLPAEIERGRVIEAGSWPEIARWIGAEPDTLTATITEYNGYCENGYDAAFAKDRRYLVPVRVPPFYAIRGEVHFLDTLGGIKINERMEVLDSHGKPLAGLFAAGVTTSGWQSESYCSDLSGSAFGYAINSGCIAGESAIRYCQEHS